MAIDHRYMRRALGALALLPALSSCNSALSTTTPNDAAVEDARQSDVGVGVQGTSCPAAEPNASDSCNWPTDLQCQYRDPCSDLGIGFGCQDTFTCVSGRYQVIACGYALGCGAATPKDGDSCACGAGHSAHHRGEGQPCNFACAEGQLIATCDVKTEKWTVSGPASCTPLADGGGATDAGDGGGPSDASDAGDGPVE